MKTIFFLFWIMLSDTNFKCFCSCMEFPQLCWGIKQNKSNGYSHNYSGLLNIGARSMGKAMGFFLYSDYPSHFFKVTISLISSPVPKDTLLPYKKGLCSRLTTFFWLNGGTCFWGSQCTCRHSQPLVANALPARLFEMWGSNVSILPRFNWHRLFFKLLQIC